MSDIQTINGMKVTDTDAATKTELNTAVEGLATKQYVDDAIADLSASGGSGGGIPTHTIVINNAMTTTESSAILNNFSDGLIKFGKDCNLNIEMDGQFYGAVYDVYVLGEEIRMYTQKETFHTPWIFYKSEDSWSAETGNAYKLAKENWMYAGALEEVMGGGEFVVAFERDGVRYTFHWVSTAQGQNLNVLGQIQMGYFNGTATGGIATFNPDEWTASLSEGDTFLEAKWKYAEE